MISSTEREGKFATLLNKVQLYEGVFDGGDIDIDIDIALSITTLETKKRESAPFYRHWGSVQAVRPIGEIELQLYSFLTTALEGVSGQQQVPAEIYSRERPGTQCTRGWVGPRARLDRCGKSGPPWIRFPDRPARSQSLYRLRFPFHPVDTKWM